MTDQEILAVVQARIDGWTIQWRHRWGIDRDFVDMVETPGIHWNWDFTTLVYREKPHEGALPRINWNQVASKYKYLVMDKHGRGVLYERLPNPAVGRDWSDCGPTPADVFSSFVPGTMELPEMKRVVSRPGLVKVSVS